MVVYKSVGEHNAHCEVKEKGERKRFSGSESKDKKLIFLKKKMINVPNITNNK